MKELVPNFFIQIKKLLDEILDIIFPPTCIICGKLEANYICKNCERRFEKYKKMYIVNNKKTYMDKLGISYDANFVSKYYLISGTKMYWEKMIFCFEYKNIVRKYMLSFKFNNCSYLSNFFAYQILNNKKVYETLKKYDIIIPVPMGKEKYMKRGYNQTELISHVISGNIGISEKFAIKKIKENKTQSLLKTKERKENVRNVFEIADKRIVKNKNVVLLDDIYTTGATINEISRILKMAGAKNILVLVIAKD